MKSQMETGRTWVRGRRNTCLVDLLLATVTDRLLSWQHKVVQLLLDSYILNIAWISRKRNKLLSLSVGLVQEVMGLNCSKKGLNQIFQKVS